MELFSRLSSRGAFATKDLITSASCFQILGFALNDKDGVRMA